MNGDLRARLVAQRGVLTPEQVAQASRQVIDRFLADSKLAPHRWKQLKVGLYRSRAQELDLRPLEARLSAWGAELFYPRVLDVTLGKMELAAGGATWLAGAFGIEEPPSSHPAVDPAALDLIFVPGVAFGLQGERLGMGAGFYDRYLPQASQALRIALAFDFQLLPELDQEPWDQRVHWIWTEKRQIQHRDGLPG